MRILHVTGARSWGGNEQQLVDVIPELNKLGVESFVIGLNDTPLQLYCNKNRIDFISVPNNKLVSLQNIKYFKKIISELKPNIIHLHTSDSVTFYLISDIFYSFKTPSVFSKKGISRKVSFLSKLKYNYPKIKKILCVSEIVKSHFKEVLFLKNYHKLTVVHDGVNTFQNKNISGIDIKKKYNISSNCRLIGNIANHTNAKDLTTFIKTLDVLINKKGINNIHFVQIGEETKRTKDLRLLVEMFQLEKWVTFLGFQENAAALLPQFTVFLMTSEREGGPTSVLEAFSQKIPVVSTKVGVVAEAIVDGENGFVATVGDYNKLAECVEELIENKELIEKFKTLSYKKFLSSYTVKELGKNTFKVYQQIV